MKNYRGYTLVELVVAVGLFALIMTLAAGAYLMMISLTQRAQNISTGIDNISFALETMTRNIRTGASYHCGGPSGGDCSSGASSFYFTNSSGQSSEYSLNGGTYIQQTINGSSSFLTDSSVIVSSLTFFVSGTSKPPSDYTQPYVTIIVSGTVSSGAGKPTQSFTVETGAAMRGTDL